MKFFVTQKAQRLTLIGMGTYRSRATQGTVAENRREKLKEYAERHSGAICVKLRDFLT